MQKEFRIARKYKILELMAKQFTDHGISLPEQKRAIARKLNISYSQLNRIINASEIDNAIDADKLVSLADHFDCSLEEILNK